MAITSKVNLWGKYVGAVADEDGRILFEYAPEYIAGGNSISPVNLPLKAGSFEFSSLRRFEAFDGLPGVLADSLPDRFGGKLVRAYFQQKGIEPGALSPVQKLLYIGRRGMGALEFEPAEPAPNADVAIPLQVAELVKEARQVIQGHITRTMTQIMQAASSAGGLRAKALIAWNRETNEIRSGQAPPPNGYEPWIIKFDATGEDGHPGPFGRIEYAYSLMAMAAGIRMMPTELLEEHGRAHYLTKRYDRENGGKIHSHSLCGLAHADFNERGIYDYDLYLRMVLLLNIGHEALEEAFRRMVFNVVACNHDDHTKNLGFLMRENGRWELAPAYDLTYAHGQDWTRYHQMRVNDKVEGITYQDLVAVAERFSIKKGKAVIAQVADAVRKWNTYARKAEVPADWMKKIEADRLLKATTTNR